MSSTAADSPFSDDVPTALVGALFVAEDGKLACQIAPGDGAGDDAPFRTTVWQGIGGAVLLAAAHSTWRPVTAPSSAHASERLGRIQVELGIAGVGNLYTCYVVRKNPAPTGPDDHAWIAALRDTPLGDLYLFPEYGSSPYMPDDWDWQEGWWYPYATFRAATPDEQAAHDQAVARARSPR